MHLVMIGGSDAGISAALRARELDPAADVTVVVADAYPNFSICGIPYYVSGEVTHWRNLAHRTLADLEAAGMRLRLDTTARRIDVPGRKLLVTFAGGGEEVLGYDKLVVGTGAVPVRPPIRGLAGPGALGPAGGVHLLHSMDDTFAVMATLEQAAPASAVIVGAGYIGLEMADALTVRGLAVTQMEQLPEVLPTVDPELGALVHAELAGHGVEVLTGTTVQAVTRAAPGQAGRLHVQATAPDGSAVTRLADMVLVVVGVRPETALAAGAGAALGVKGAIAVDPGMRTSLPDVFAAGDCVITRHRRPRHRAAARPAAVRAPPRRDRQAHRHRRHRDLPRHDRRRDQRPRPVLHPAARQPLEAVLDAARPTEPPAVRHAPAALNRAWLGQRRPPSGLPLHDVQARASACSSTWRSADTAGAPSAWPFSPAYRRHAIAGTMPEAANGSRPSTSSVGDPYIPQRAASASSVISRRVTVTPGRPATRPVSLSCRTKAFGQSGTASTVNSITTASSARITHVIWSEAKASSGLEGRAVPSWPALSRPEAD